MCGHLKGGGGFDNLGLDQVGHYHGPVFFLCVNLSEGGDIELVILQPGGGR